MSTRINVNIGDGGLLDRNAQQQAAARQANQQRATANKAAAEGQRQLEAVRISQGRDPVTGERLPSAGSSSRIQRIDQEPAANRRDGIGVLLVPEFSYAPYGGMFTGIRGRTKGGTIIFSRNLFDFTFLDFGFTPPLIYGDEMDVVQGGGPLGLNALRVLEPVSPLIEIQDWQPGLDPTAIPEGTWYKLTSQDYLASLRYALVTAKYDSVGRNVYQNVPDQVDPPATGELLLLSGNVVPAIPKKRCIDFENLTHEFMVNLTNNASPQSGAVISEVSFADGRSASVTVSAEGVSFLVSASERVGSVAPNPLENPAGYSVWMPPFLIVNEAKVGLQNVFDITFNSEWQVFLRITDGNLSTSDSFTSSTGRIYSGWNETVIGGFSNVYPDPRLTSADALRWVHCAMVRRRNPSTGKREWSFYWAGVRLATAEIKPEWDTTFGNRPLAAGIELRATIGSRSIPEYILPSIHGYRFTPRALYDGDTIQSPAAINRLL
jgi:hypothetical protein